MAKIVKPNGAVESRETGDPDGFALEEVQKMVGGYIELVQLQTPVKFSDDPQEYTMMVLNEEGKLRGLPFNAVATGIWQDSMTEGEADDLVGNVVFVTRRELQ